MLFSFALFGLLISVYFGDYVVFFGEINWN